MRTNEMMYQKYINRAAVLTTLFVGLTFLIINSCATLSGGKFEGEHTIIVEPFQAHQLKVILRKAAPGSTFLLKDGLYPIDEHLSITKAGITIRSYSGDREKVIIDGRYRGYVIKINAPEATIADLTIKRAKYHLVHVAGNGHHATLTNLHLIDARQQFVKANPSGGRFCDYGTVQNCLFELTEDGRRRVDPQLGGCYSGGIDVLAARGWIVRDNRFEDIYCTNGGLPTHMVLFWQSSRDSIVERNTIINCARGIGFGLGQKTGRRTYEDIEAAVAGNANHFGGVIRRNLIFGNIGKYFDTGIGLEHAWNAEVYNNIVYTTGGTFSSIDVRFPGCNPVIRDNWTNHRITIRNGAKPLLQNNVTRFEEAGGNTSRDQ